MIQGDSEAGKQGDRESGKESEKESGILIACAEIEVKKGLHRETRRKTQRATEKQKQKIIIAIF